MAISLFTSLKISLIFYFNVSKVNLFIQFGIICESTNDVGTGILELCGLKEGYELAKYILFCSKPVSFKYSFENGATIIEISSVVS
jgi:hypothetical protein